MANSKQPTGIVVQVDEDLQRLSAQEERVLRLLFGIREPPHSRDELGMRLGMSRSWLHQVERRALRNLRCAAVGEESTSEADVQ